MKWKIIPVQRRHRRRGSTYVVVLGASMLVMVIGLSALFAVRVQRRAARGTGDLAQARLYAQSAIEYGFLLLIKDTDWRNILGTGLWATDQPIGNGSFSLEVRVVGRIDTKIKSDDTVALVGTGVSGPARHQMEVRIVPSGGGMVVSPGSWVQIVN